MDFQTICHTMTYMRNLAFKRDAPAINEAFERVRKLGGDTKSIWAIYKNIGSNQEVWVNFFNAKAQEAFNLYPNDENIFQLLQNFNLWTTKNI